jgi:2-keto-4-pentenoate hydratase/2-oxohepta-3-ene-1,7-dioic acid hydratase in catechol pathway
VEHLPSAGGVMTLEPGDVLLTGTPPGVGTLAAGRRRRSAAARLPLLTLDDLAVGWGERA